MEPNVKENNACSPSMCANPRKQACIMGRKKNISTTNG
jgi:hypothetical protein